MAKRTTTYVCQSCGAVHSRWQGRCDGCGAWNTISEETTTSGPASGPGPVSRRGRRVALVPLKGEVDEAPRVLSGLGELDRVTGGGFVRGSVLLVGGDPGIGKSTLLLQAAAALGRRGQPVVYVSGEEAIAQGRLRAERLWVVGAPGAPPPPAFGGGIFF